MVGSNGAKRREKRWLLWAACAWLLLLSCNLSGGPNAENPAARFDVVREEALYLDGAQPRTLDPAKTNGGPAGPIGHIFSGLVRLDSSLQVQPDLAAGWDVDDEGEVFTFFLHRGAVFHDGRRVTADDIVYSWERAANPATGSDTAATYLGDIVGVDAVLAGETDQIRGVRALDAHTLRVTIDAPKPYFLAKLAYPVAYVVDRENVQEAEWERAPNGSGPFRLEAWEDDQIMVLAANERFYGGPPALAHVVYLLDAGLSLARYETGQIDLVGVGGATLERVQDPNNPLGAELRTGVNMCTSTIGFNARQTPFSDPMVRRAFSMALDEERLIEGVIGGDALPATGPLPPGMPGYVARPDPYPYDPEGARALLEEAGVGPLTLSFSTAGYGDVSPYVAAVITMWEENLGVTIEPELLDPFLYTETLYGGEVGDLFNFGWCADYPDPQNFLDVLFGSGSVQNIGGFGDPAVDAMLAEARVEADPQQRLVLYQEVEELIIEQAPAVFVSHGLSAVLVKPYVRGYELTPIGVRQWDQVSLGER